MQEFGNSLLYDRLAEALPKDYRFIFHHVSTPPTPCDAIFSAPPGKRPEKTFCETQFLSVSIESPGAAEHGQMQIHIFGIEVLVYSTRKLTTIFVSKADSSGYLHLLKLPKGAPPTFKTIASIFLRYLVEQRQRPRARLVVSLFARAANEYLFRGSVQGNTKNILDDRNLIRWWCQVLDTVFAPSTCVPIDENEPTLVASLKKNQNVSVRGFLRIPGYDARGTASFFPESRESQDGSKQTRWTVGDPLRELGRDLEWPERCLIPRFPDDPKCRFLVDLDDELPASESEADKNSIDLRHNGRWRSVRSLEEFWESMSWRQECAAGRAVGFLWGLFVPPALEESLDPQPDSPSPQTSPAKPNPQSQLSGAIESQVPSISTRLGSSPHSSPFRDTEVSQSPATPNCTATNTQETSATTPCTAENSQIQIASHSDLPKVGSTICKISHETKYYYWPIAGRGEYIVGQEQYDLLHRKLISLDYDTEGNAKASTGRWLKEVTDKSETKGSCHVAVGRKEISQEISNSIPQAPAAAAPAVTLLGTGLIRKKNKRPRDIVNVEEGRALLPSGVLDGAQTLQRTELTDYEQQAKRPRQEGMDNPSEFDRDQENTDLAANGDRNGWSDTCLSSKSFL